MEHDLEYLQQQLNNETGKIGWQELQRHFARGVVIRVSGQLDLVDVATCVAQDDRDKVELWMQQGLVARAGTEDALEWQQHQAEFWAVVIAPWVLVQERVRTVN